MGEVNVKLEINRNESEGKESSFNQLYWSNSKLATKDDLFTQPYLKNIEEVRIK